MRESLALLDTAPGVFGVSERPPMRFIKASTDPV